MRSYPLGHEFPHEGFVQRAIESHFIALGFQLNPRGNADLSCKHPSTGEHWLVEAKGQTSSVGLDFHTGLGQLVKQMDDANCNYALAMPATPQFIRQCQSVNLWVRIQLHLYWLIVADDQKVNVIAPDENQF